MQAWKDIRRCWQQLDNLQIVQLPKWRQLAEMTALFLLRRIGPGYYIQGKFWRPDLPFRDKWLHVNNTEYNDFIDRWNARPYQKSSQHKVVEKAVLQLLAVPTPEFIAYLHPQAGVSADGAPLRTLAQLKQLCAGLVGQKICLKLVEGFGGAGFSAFTVVQQTDDVAFEHPFTRVQVSIESWWQQSQQNSDGYIIERYLQQHPAVEALHPNSVNTLRIWVYQLPDRTEIAGSFLRIGQKNSMVDNTSCGGLYCPIDQNTGTLLYAVCPLEPWSQLAQHPDTGAQVSGVQIPFWAECQAIAGKALQAFPHVRVAGVDVAIAPEGPQMIELNVRPDQIGCTRMDVPLKRIDQKLKQAYAGH